MENSHERPDGIRREAKGVYVTLDGAHRIVQEGKVWRLVEVTGDSQVGIGEFKTRNAAVQALAAAGKLPAEPAKAEEPQQAKGEGKAKEQPKRRPRTRKQPAKAIAASA